MIQVNDIFTSAALKPAQLILPWKGNTRNRGVSGNGNKEIWKTANSYVKSTHAKQQLCATGGEKSSSATTLLLRTRAVTQWVHTPLPRKPIHPLAASHHKLAVTAISHGSEPCLEHRARQIHFPHLPNGIHCTQSLHCSASWLVFPPRVGCSPYPLQHRRHKLRYVKKTNNN